MDKMMNMTQSKIFLGCAVAPAFGIHVHSDAKDKHGEVIFDAERFNKCIEQVKNVGNRSMYHDPLDEDTRNKYKAIATQITSRSWKAYHFLNDLKHNNIKGLDGRVLDYKGLSPFARRKVKTAIKDGEEYGESELRKDLFEFYRDKLHPDAEPMKETKREEIRKMIELVQGMFETFESYQIPKGTAIVRHASVFGKIMKHQARTGSQAVHEGVADQWRRKSHKVGKELKNISNLISGKSKSARPANTDELPLNDLMKHVLDDPIEDELETDPDKMTAWEYAEYMEAKARGDTWPPTKAGADNQDKQSVHTVLEMNSTGDAISVGKGNENDSTFSVAGESM